MKQSGIQHCRKHRELGLTDAEFELICDKLGREPNDVELAMFSLLWSEHCAYKHSRKLLRRLPTEGERVVMGPGENAGAVSIGDGWAVAFKVESHNHPSAVEPFQGAATGVGGILRDVFALGARPIAILDSLRFGELDSERSRYLFDHVVAGIGHYGNSIGVPTVGGEVYFEAALRAELPRQRDVRRARPHRRDGPRGGGRGRQRGRPDGRLDRARRDRRRLGARLGRARGGRRLEAPDGADRRPVRGDEGARVLPRAARRRAARLAPGPRRGRADLLGGRDGLGGRRRDRHRRRPGAAARGRHGAVRDHGLGVAGADARRGRAGEGRRRCSRSARSWETGAAAIGEVTDYGRLPRPPRRRGGRRDAGRRPSSTTARSTTSSRPSPRAGSTATRTQIARRRPEPRRRPRILLALLGSPTIASKRWAFEQYDSIVGSRTVRRPETADAAVLHLPEAGTAIAVSIDGNGRRVACDPYAGTIEAVLECAQNLACVGAEPLGLTNCLNFGNPEKPTVAWQLDRSTQALADACEALGVPVVGGNVSLYNETEDGPIYPTPVVGMVGELPDPERAGGLALRDGDAIALVGPFAPVARRLGAGEAARRARRRACRSLPIAAGRRRDRRGPRGGPRRAGQRRPRHQRRRPRLRARRDGDRRRRRPRRRPRRADRGARLLGETALFGEGPAASWSPASAPSSSARRRRDRRSARPAATGSRIRPIRGRRPARRRRARLALARRAASRARTPAVA